MAMDLDASRGWMTSVESVVPDSIAVERLILFVVNETLPEVALKPACTWRFVVVVIDAPPTDTSPANRVAPVTSAIVSVPPTVSVPANITLAACVIVRLPETVTLPANSTVVAASISRSPSIVVVLAIVNVPAFVTWRSPVRATDCWRETGCAVVLVRVRSSSLWLLPIAPVTVM